MSEEPLKTRAQKIMTAIQQELQQIMPAQSDKMPAEVDERANALVNMLFNVVSDVDIETATQRANQLKTKYPDASPEELTQMLIREKCRKTGTVGAVTSGAGLIPGLGTVAATTLGVPVDIGATFRLQAELVLETAAVYNYPLTEQEKRQLVMFITGLSAGTAALSRRAGEKAAAKIGEMAAEETLQKTILKALPIIGVAASAGTNALSTYIIGQRADAYFRLGPEAVGNWSDNLRAITGVDERKLTAWLAESGRAAGQAIMTGAGRVAGAAARGTQQAGQMAQTGVRAYVRWVWRFWRAMFTLLTWILKTLWSILTFVPRKISTVIRRGITRRSSHGQ